MAQPVWTSDETLPPKGVTLNRSLCVTWALMSLACVVTGPFGTYEGMALGQRVMIWPFLLGFGFVLAAVLRYIAEHLLGLYGLMPGGILVALVHAAVYPFVVLGVLSAWSGNPMPQTPPYGELAAFVFCVAILAGRVRELARKSRANDQIWPTGPKEPVLPPARADAMPGPQAPVLPEPEAPVVPLILSRLPAEVHGPLLRMSSRDHYVDVHTALGSASVLIRLSDAIREASLVQGLQVHRSHWVACDAIEGLVRRSGQIRLILRDGTDVPVGRSFRPGVDALDLPDLTEQCPHILALAGQHGD